MADSKQLAGLIGPAMIAITASEALNFQIWATSMPQVVYLNGTILFVAGLAIIRAHNRWVAGWPVLITLTGWFVFLEGSYRIFVPEARQAPDNAFTYVGLIILFAAGAAMTFEAYGRDGPDTNI